MTGGEDHSEAAKAIEDLRHQDEQESNCPRLVEDHFKRGNGNGVHGPHHLRVRRHGMAIPL